MSCPATKNSQIGDGEYRGMLQKILLGVVVVGLFFKGGEDDDTNAVAN